MSASHEIADVAPAVPSCPDWDHHDQQSVLAYFTLMEPDPATDFSRSELFKRGQRNIGKWLYQSMLKYERNETAPQHPPLEALLDAAAFATFLSSLMPVNREAPITDDALCGQISLLQWLSDSIEVAHGALRNGTS